MCETDQVQPKHGAALGQDFECPDQDVNTFFRDQSANVQKPFGPITGRRTAPRWAEAGNVDPVVYGVALRRDSRETLPDRLGNVLATTDDQVEVVQSAFGAGGRVM